MNPDFVFTDDKTSEATPTDIRLDSARTISIMMGLDSGKREKIEFLGENKFSVTGGVSCSLYDCLRCTNGDAKVLEDELAKFIVNCEIPESEKYPEKGLFIGSIHLD
jgi:hypothetical protein